MPSRTHVSASPNLPDRINIKLISFSVYLFRKPDFLNKSFFSLFMKRPTAGLNTTIDLERKKSLKLEELMTACGSKRI